LRGDKLVAVTFVYPRLSYLIPKGRVRREEKKKKESKGMERTRGYRVLVRLWSLRRPKIIELRVLKRKS